MSFLLPLFLITLVTAVSANNLEVADVALTSQSPSAGEVTIRCDLSWENSWRTTGTPANYDAAWVFAKYRVGSGPWRHAELAYVDGTNDGHTVPVGGELLGVPGGTGVFVFRRSPGTGDILFPDLGLRWDYGADGVGNTAQVEVRVFAIEMVFVPEGAFFAGDPAGGAANTFRRLTIVSGGTFATRPYFVSSDGPISYGTFNLQYNNDLGTSGGDQLGPIPESYPVGFDAFYCMKYETTQGQWIDFFNTLTPAQKIARDLTGLEGKNTDGEAARNGVSWPDTGSATTTLPDIPINFVNYANLTAYLDWAGLRMMSEFEFEKACRGPEGVVPGEFAWGTASIYEAAVTLQNQGLASERISNPGSGTGNATYSGLTDGQSGPLRVGIHAASAVTPSREETGASYYGIMDLSGNLYERCVTVGSPGGRSFVPNHGDGSLSASGDANVAGWPGPVDSSYRGAGHANSSPFLRVSDRTDGANSFDITNSRIGFRGIRSAP